MDEPSHEIIDPDNLTVRNILDVVDLITELSGRDRLLEIGNDSEVRLTISERGFELLRELFHELTEGLDHQLQTETLSPSDRNVAIMRSRIECGHI